MRSFRVDRGEPCPSCHEDLDAATAIDGRGKAPKPGDITICLYCASVLAFVDGGGLRLVPESEWSGFHVDTVTTLRRARALCAGRRSN